MKELFYSLFALFFRLWRIFPVKKNSVCFISMHNEMFNDSLGAVKKYLEKIGGYDISYIDKNDLNIKKPLKAARFFISGSGRLARAEYVFLNDNFMPMSRLSFSPETTVTQLWHAEGAFKKFGFSIEQPEQVRKNERLANERLDYVVCSSEKVADIYAEAFGVQRERVLPLGSPRTDLLFNVGDREKIREDFLKSHPFCRGKKIVLYAPTFRDEPESDALIAEKFDLEALNRALGDEYAFFVRLHPQIHCSIPDPSVDLTDYPDVTKLMLICDILITDYSSICMDFALLGKPVVFYAFDLESYEKSRSFYFDYESYVPGEVVRDITGLTECLKRGPDKSKLKFFADFNFGVFDGKAAERTVNRIIKKS